MIKKILLYALLAVVLFIGVVGINLFLFTRKARVVSTGAPIAPRESGKAALFVIDLQGTTTGTVSQSQDYKGMSEWLIPRVNRLSEQADSLDMPVIYIVNVVSLVNSQTLHGPRNRWAKPDGS
jgi:hypothetical protein